MFTLELSASLQPLRWLGTFVYDKVCDRWPPRTSHLTFPLSFSSSYPLFFVLSDFSLNPWLLTRSLQQRMWLPSRRCAIPWGVGLSEAQGARWCWLECEWAERPQEKPQCTFMCHGLYSMLDPHPMGQHSPSCRSNNSSAAPYAWARIHTLSLCVHVCWTAYKHNTRQCWVTAVENIMCPATLRGSHYLKTSCQKETPLSANEVY